ncbi:hypothetical protein BJX96DRAFT_61940 [Aspergillus floccosus]
MPNHGCCSYIQQNTPPFTSYIYIQHLFQNMLIVSQAPITNLLQPRQNTSSDCPSTISGGGIAGIVLGTIAGTLLILWLVRLCSLPGAFNGEVPEREYSTTGGMETRHRRRRRRSPTYFEYVEKPARSVRRPAKVYLS